MILSFLSLIACTGETGEAGASITGTLTTSDSQAEVASRTAYGFHIDGRGFWYISTAADVPCSEVLAYLNHAGGAPYDPSEVLHGGFCNLTLVSDYEGVETSITEEDAWLVGWWSLYCPMGTGEFVFEERRDHEDYYWSGSTWTGEPETWTTTISGDGENDGYTIDVEMTDFSGNYGDVIEEIPAAGSVGGSIDVTWCPDLYTANAFPK